MISRSRIKVCDIATTHVLTITADLPLEQAITLFAEQRISCLVVAEQGRPVGIITERDLLRLSCAGYDPRRPVRAVMSAPLLTARQDLDFALAWNMLSNRSVRHLVLVDDNGLLRGVVSATDFRQHIGHDLYEVIQHLGVVLNSSDELIAPERPLLEVLEIMAARRLDHVIIGDQLRRPLGILTERDVPQLLSQGADIHNLQVQQVMSQPLKTVPAGIGVSAAAAELGRCKLRHLVAVDKNGCFAGVISQHRMLERLSAALLAQERDQLAQQVAIGEQRFRLFVENMQMPLCHIDANDQLVYVNQSFSSAFGYRLQDIPDLGSWWQQVCPDSSERQRVIEQWRNAMADSRQHGLPIKPFEQPLTDRAGNPRIVEVTGTALGDEFLATFVDLTEQHRQQRLLEIQARRAQALLELPRLADQLDEQGLLERGRKLLSELTGSQLAFLKLLDGSQLASWSGCLHSDCSSEPHLCSLHHLADSHWIDSPRLYPDSEHPLPIELPSDCPGRARLAVLPLYDNGQPVMLVGVAERRDDYSEAELETLQLVAGEVWRIIQRRRTSEVLRASEASLRETASRLQEAQKIACIGNWQMDQSSGLVSCSAEALRILEIPPAEFMGSADEISQLFHPDDFPQLQLLHRQALASGQPYEHSCRLRMPDGRIKHLHLRTEVHLDTQGLPLRVVGTLQDVTEQRAMELALKALATTLAPLAGADFYQSAARHLADALGLDHAFVGQLEPEQDRVLIISGWGQGQPMTPMAYHLRDTPCANVMKRGCSIHAGQVQRLFPRDQLLIDMQVESYIGSALFDKQQQPMGILVGLSRNPLRQPALAESLFNVFVDRISAEMLRLQAENELSEREQHFRTLADGGTALIWTAGEHRNSDYFNQPWLKFTGRTLDEECGLGWSHSVHPDDLARLLATYADGFRQRLPLQCEYRLLRHDGSYRWISDLGNPRYDSAGNFIGYIGFGHDITERKEIEDRLQEYKTAVEQALDGIAIADMDGQIRFVNAAWADMHGRERASLIGQPLSMFHDLSQLNDAVQPFMARLLDHGTSRGELQHLRSNGDSFPASVTATVLRDSRMRAQAIFMSIRDITASKQTEDRLRQAASVFEHASEGILITDASACILDVNNAFSRITGYNRNEVLGQNPRLLKSGRQKRSFYEQMWRQLLSDGHWSGEQWNRRKDGQEYVERLTISAIRNEQGQVLRYVGLFSDITPLWEQKAQLEFIAHNDALTRLPNRVKLASQLQRAIESASEQGSLLAVAYLDLDGFKAVNDHHGHGAGDRLLVQLAERMQQALRPGDCLARLGGDEFVAVLPALPDQQACIAILDRLLESVVKPVNIDGMLLHVSASIGVTFYPQADVVDADQLLRQADQAMYQAKQAGKNRYHLFDAEHDREVRGRHESIEHIRQGLANQEFVLFYQPKVNLRSGTVIGVEALIRWQHPSRGLLAPATFLPVIENHQLAVDVGNWVLTEACRQFEAWHREGLYLPVSVNINAIHAMQAGFVDYLRDLLTSHPEIGEGDLELEILETSAFQDLEQMSSIIEQCRELGVRFSLDDFGTGYSSLTYLKHLPVQLLKIDQSFVHDVLEDPDDLSILDGVLSLAGAFQREVIAEGVETPAHAEMLLQMGCDYGQGYAIARPMPAAELADWSRDWHSAGRWQVREQVERRDLTVLYAMVEHRAWVSSLHHYLLAEHSAPPPLDSQQCRLGRWLHSEGVHHAANPAMARLLCRHEDVHALASELLRMPPQQALAQFERIELLRDELLQLLQQLID